MLHSETKTDRFHYLSMCTRTLIIRCHRLHRYVRGDTLVASVCTFHEEYDSGSITIAGIILVTKWRDVIFGKE